MSELSEKKESCVVDLEIDKVFLHLLQSYPHRLSICMLPAGSNLSHFCEIGICAAMTASKKTGFKKVGHELRKSNYIAN